MKKNKLLRAAVLMLLIATICVVYNIIISSRCHVFYDELISFYRSSELCGRAGRFDWINPDKGMNQIFHGSDFSDQLGVSDSNSLLDGRNIGKLPKLLVNGRQYFVFLNIITSITGNFFAIEDIMILNTILLVVIFLLIYFLASDMYGSWLYGMIAAVLTATAGGVFITFGYYRFYILYALYALVLVYMYYLLDSKSYNAIIQVVLLVLSLMATWFGYRNAEYMIIFSALMFAAYVVLEISRKAYTKIILALAVYIPAGIAGTIMMYPSIKRSLEHGKLSGIHMDQMHMAIHNLLTRPIGTFAFFLKVFLGFFLRFTCSPYVWLVLFCIAIGVCLFRRGNNVIEVNRFQILLGAVILCYLVVIAKIAPWDTWRYVNISFFLGILFVTGLFRYIELGKYSKAMISFLLLCNLLYFCTYGVNKSMQILEAYGPTTTDREYMISNYADSTNVYFYGGNSDTLFYGAFLWPDDARYYLTTNELFEEDTESKQEILDNDRLLVWIDYQDGALEKADESMQKENYVRNQLVLDTGIEGGHYVYEYVRK